MPKRRKLSPAPRSRKVNKTRKTRSRANTAWWHRVFIARWWLWVLVPTLLFGIWVVYLDWVVRAKFEGKKWALPARVYAQPLELYAGLTFTPQALVQELKTLGYQPVAQVNKPGQVSAANAVVSAYTRGFSFWDKAELPQTFVATFAGSMVVDLTDQMGNPLSLVRLEPQEIGGIYPAHMEDRLLVRLQDIPPVLGEALIAVEDRHFLEHHGVSLRGIARAAYVNFKSGAVVQGGSTLTQQLVKNFYLNQERSLTRKLVEAIMSVSLDFHYSKSEILETYLNEVYLGQSGSRGIHGFALGAQHYFRQPLQELKLHQVALLVGIVKGASYYNPWRHPERAKERRNVVIEVMREEGLIDPLEAEIASRQGLDVVAEGNLSVFSYPAFIDLVKRQLRRDYQEEDLRSEGLRIFTTLSPSVQQAAERALATRLAQLEKDFAIEPNSLQGAAVISDVGSGEILAVVGDRKRDFLGFNRALDAQRAIGSLVKPAIFLTALAQPEKYTLLTKVDDAELSVFIDGDNIWQPQNFSLESHGLVPLYQALAQSYNQASARLGYELGVPQVTNTLRRLGVEQTIPEVPAILLGAISLTPLEVSSMYQTIAAEGVFTPQRAIRSVLDAQGQPLSRYPLDSEIRFSPALMQLLHFGLLRTMREGTGKTIYAALPEDFSLAGKTGTTNDHRDSWFAGFTADHLGVIWVGRDDNAPTPLTGATGAMRIWADVFNQVPSRSLELLPTPGVEMLWVDPEGGGLSREGCANAVQVPFILGSEPRVKAKCRGGFPWFRG